MAVRYLVRLDFYATEKNTAHIGEHKIYYEGKRGERGNYENAYARVCDARKGAFSKRVQKQIIYALRMGYWSVFSSVSQIDENGIIQVLQYKK